MNEDDDITKNEDNLDIGGKLLSYSLVDMMLIGKFEHCSEVW
jgi:hypothetical protein